MSVELAGASSKTIPTATGERGWLAAHPWGAIFLLAVIGILNFLDRVLPSILAEQIKHDLGLSDGIFGLINGFGFLVIYAAASIPIARFSDRGHHNLVVVAALALWSTLTVLGGLAMSGWMFAMSRMGVALGEAGGTPAAHAYILRNIPLSRRATALSFYMLSVPLGSMAGFAIGGIIGEQLGWRLTFMIMGGIGLSLSAVTYFALGVGRGSTAITTTPAADPAPATPSLKLLLAKKSVLAILAGSSFIGMAGYTTLTFTPAFLMRSHGMSLAEAGVTYGIGGGVAGIVSLLVVGFVADRLARHDLRWFLGTVIGFLVICLPLSIMSFTVADDRLALFGLSMNHAILVAHATPVFAAFHSLAPPDLRARGTALLLIASAILGGLGPAITGAISDALTSRFGPEALGNALLLVPIAFVLAGVCYAVALVTYKNELAER